MDIRINKMTLQNFKGIKHLEINAGGESLTIYGDNATGKTTVFDAFTWLLFNKDSLGRSDFGIKTQDENGNVLHNLEHSVECELAIDNSILTLKKVYAEKWTKKRGSADAEFSGHETKYFVNEVPTTKKEYEQKITGIIDENLFKIITNPLYFNEHLKWQDRRAILLSLCENITDDEIISNNAEFTPLLEELKGRTVQEYKKIIQSKQAGINDELKSIPQRIAEATLAIPATVENVDETERAVIEQKIAELNDEIMAIKNNSGVIELNALKAKRVQLENSTCDTTEISKELSDAKLNLKDTEYKIRLCRQDISNINNSIAEHEEKAASLRKEWHEVNEKQYTDNGICPTCGQKLPDEQITEAKAKFNISRAEKLDTITAKGKQEKAEIDKLQNLRIETAAQIDRLLKSADLYTAKIETITAEIEKRLNIQDDIETDLDRENGSLEQKLDLLREIADEYGTHITKSDRDRLEALNDKEADGELNTREQERQFDLIELIDEADEKLANFGETYEKIIKLNVCCCSYFGNEHYCFRSNRNRFHHHQRRI